MFRPRITSIKEEDQSDEEEEDVGSRGVSFSSTNSVLTPEDAIIQMNER